jgi:hypothetical protein
MPALLTASHTNGRAAVPFGSASGRTADPMAPPVRYLIIVRRNERAVFEYLSARMRGIDWVEVKLDERESASEPPQGDRRGSRRRFNAFGVQIIRRRAGRGEEPSASL